MTNHKVFKVYRSSAGSGKTFTLTKEYLKIALATPRESPQFEPYYFRHVLAVTFTNDAAKEMKERILKVLGSLANYQPSQPDKDAKQMLALFLEELPQEYPDTPWTEPLIITRAKAIYQSLLHNYSDFAVSTIDSFTNRIVQAFKKDLGFPYSHEIELETASLKEEAALELQRRIKEGDNQALNNMLVEFATRKADEGKSWFIHRDLEEFANNLFSEEKYEAIKRLQHLTPLDFEQMKEKVYAYTTSIDTKVKALAQEALDLIQRHDVQPPSFYYGARGIYGYFSKHASLSEFLYKLEANSYALKTINNDEWLSGKGKKDAGQKAGVEAIQRELTQFFLQIEEIRNKERSNYTIAHQLRHNIYLLATINELDKHLQVIKDRERIIHISDFNRSINSIVEEEPIPYIYERIGERYYHILIDEFQDTSRMQWHNLIPLVSNGLGFGLQNLVVGDAKQAIYRWRGGNSDMLVQLPNVPTADEDSAIQEQIPMLGSHYQPVNLDSNYRSLEQIVAFNNSFFTGVASIFESIYPAVQGYYKEVAQKSLPHKKGGKVELRQFITDKPLKVKEYTAFQLAETLQLIEELRTEGYQLSDIAILTRKNSHCSQMALHLLNHDIEVRSSDSLLVGSAGVVQLLLEVLHVLHRPAAQQQRMELLLCMQRHWSRIFPAEDWGNLFDGDKGTQYLSRAADKDCTLESLTSLLEEAFGARLPLAPMRLMPIYELCETLIRALHLQEVPSEQAYLHGFLDFVLESTGRRGNDLDNFLEFWARKADKLSISVPEGENAVRIMSIHRSKGLQFPVVIVPFVDWDARPHAQESLWLPWSNSDFLPELPSIILKISSQLEGTDFEGIYHQELQASFLDSFNLLYVALTRPEERLYMIGQKHKTPDLDKKPCKDMGEVLSLYLEGKGLLENPSVVLDREAVLGKETLQAFVGIWHLSDISEADKAKPKKQERMHTLLLHPLHTVQTQNLRVREEKISKHDIDLEEIRKSKERREVGTIMHTAFEKVEYAEDIAKAVKSALHQGLISPSLEQPMAMQMQEVVKLGPIARYYTKGIGLRVLNEQEIILNSTQNRRGATARPDRLVIDGDTAVIIDYKTGKRKPQSYNKQVGDYCEYMRQIGYDRVKGFVVYTELLEVDEI